MLSFWSAISPWNLEWMYFLSLFHLVNSSVQFCLSMVCQSLGSWVFCSSMLLYVFNLCFHNKYGGWKFLSRQTVTSSQVTDYEKWQYQHEVDWRIGFVEFLAMLDKMKKCSFLDDESQMMLSTWTLKEPIPQNGQTHSNNCLSVLPFCKIGA